MEFTVGPQSTLALAAVPACNSRTEPGDGDNNDPDSNCPEVRTVACFREHGRNTSDPGADHGAGPHRLVSARLGGFPLPSETVADLCRAWHRSACRSPRLSAPPKPRRPLRHIRGPARDALPLLRRSRPAFPHPCAYDTSRRKARSTTGPAVPKLRYFSVPLIRCRRASPAPPR